MDTSAFSPIIHGGSEEASSFDYSAGFGQSPMPSGMGGMSPATGYSPSCVRLPFLHPRERMPRRRR